MAGRYRVRHGPRRRQLPFRSPSWIPERQEIPCGADPGSDFGMDAADEGSRNRMGLQHLVYADWPDKPASENGHRGNQEEGYTVHGTDEVPVISITESKSL